MALFFFVLVYEAKNLLPGRGGCDAYLISDNGFEKGFL